MPKLGADMDAGKLVAWRFKPGESVAKGQILADVETDKAEVEVESFFTGVLERILVEPGTKVPVGTPLAIVRLPGEAEGAMPEAAAAAGPPAPEAAAPPVPSEPAPEAARLLISPAARARARELGLDAAGLKGTGPGGRITLEDVEAARGGAPPVAAMLPQQPRPAPPPSKEDAQARMRQAIAAAMSRSKREIPHYYLSHTLDLGPAAAWLLATNAQRGVEGRLLMGALLVKALALALREVPELNGFWTEGAFHPSAEIHIGLAISLRSGGLMAPALHHADQASLDDLNQRMADLVRRTRSGGLRGSELTDPTITLTSLGDRGVEAVFGVIHPPQVALVGLGRMLERPWVVAGRVEPRKVMTATLSADHRTSDGHRGGLLLAAMDRLLSTPEAL
ncbi:MAG TPA: dihydrolipoamide acetyltransferase family protein [Holophagaceae bacterium]|nr:dihydrolipoamide acetyltransferase family protein [Holophagaceae bacterium]